MGGGAETMYNQITLKFYSYSNQKNEKKKKGNWSLLIKIISTAPKGLFFKTTDLYTMYTYSLNIQTTKTSST